MLDLNQGVSPDSDLDQAPMIVQDPIPEAVAIHVNLKEKIDQSVHLKINKGITMVYATLPDISFDKLKAIITNEEQENEQEESKRKKFEKERKTMSNSR